MLKLKLGDMRMYEKVIISLVSVLLGGCISFFSSKYMLNKNSRVQANNKFRSVFIGEVYSLEKAILDVHEILSNTVFEKHERAKLEFEIFLSKRELECFAADWSIYSKYIQFHSGQKIAPGSIEVRERECRKAKQRIKSLLKYTINA